MKNIRNLTLIMTVSSNKNNLTIVTTIFNEEENIPHFISDVNKNLKNIKNFNFDIILVDNGSTDNSLEIIKKFSKKDKKIKYISLTRNFGHQGGLFAGLFHSKSKYTLTIDCDLQQPLSLVPEMLNYAKKGFKIVTGYKKKDFSFISIIKYFFYKIFTKVSGLKMQFGQSDFNMIHIDVLDYIKQIKDQRIFLRGSLAWLGFKHKKIIYKANKRKFGVTKFSINKYFSFALDGLIQHTFLPIRIFTILGFIMTILTLSYLIYVFCGVLFFDFIFPAGWFSTILIIGLFSSMNFIGIGILGEYIARLFEQVKDRPMFVINEKNFR